MIFKNREEAGIKLAERLKKYQGKANLIVLGVPRGGVVVAFYVAKSLGCPLSLIIARKIGAPGNPEFALGAVNQDGEVVLNSDIFLDKTTKEYILKESQKQQKEIQRRLKIFLGKEKPPDLRGKIVILVDDGIATGSTLLAAIKGIKKQKPQKIIVAVPVAPRQSILDLEKEVDEVVCLICPEVFFAVGQFYEDFSQVEDEEVKEILKNYSKIMKESQRY